MEDDRLYSFNFWPAFADLMLSLILLLLLVIGATYFLSIDFRSIEEKQQAIIDSLATNGRVRHASESGILICETGSATCDSKSNVLYRMGTDPFDPTQQTISFSNKLLFDSGEYKLKPEGEAALQEVCHILIANLKDIVEIQIRGHADNTPTAKNTLRRYEDNLELASRRANEVFRFLTCRDLEKACEPDKIDPAEHLISATSFGEFSPVKRKRDGTYNRAQLVVDNQGEDLDLNRRIELVLFFNRPADISKTAPR